MRQIALLIKLDINRILLDLWYSKTSKMYGIKLIIIHSIKLKIFRWIIKILQTHGTILNHSFIKILMFRIILGIIKQIAPGITSYLKTYQIILSILIVHGTILETKPGTLPGTIPSHLFSKKSQ